MNTAECVVDVNLALKCVFSIQFTSLLCRFIADFGCVRFHKQIGQTVSHEGKSILSAYRQGKNAIYLMYESTQRFFLSVRGKNRFSVFVRYAC